MQLIKWYFRLIGALNNKHSTSNIYFSVSMKNWSTFQTNHLTNSQTAWGHELDSLSPSIPFILLPPDLLWFSNKHQSMQNFH